MVENNRQIEFEEIYLKTTYFVIDDEFEIAFRIGETNLDELLEKKQAKTWAFISAHNPFSKQFSTAENDVRQRRLIDLLKSKNLRFLEGFGESTSADWENETSAFILDIELEDALSIGKHFEQNAIVFGELGGVPRLIWC